MALWPKNADRHFALQTLIDALGSEPAASGGSEAGAAEWMAWLASEGGKPIQEIQPDGFHDAPTAVEATVLGTCQTLLAGQLEFPALHYRLWMQALADGDDSHLQAGRELLTAATSLCSTVVERAQIGAYKWPDHRRPSPIAVPPEEEFERLRAALRIEFDDPEVPRILGPLQRGPEVSSWRPLSRETESMLLIADPWQFSLAALVRSLDLAARSPQWATVLAKVRNAALAVAIEAAEEMEWTVESVEEEHLVARADVNCRVVLGVGVLSPDPAQRDAESVSADGDLAAWHERIASRARSLGATHSLLAVIGDGRFVFGDDPALRASAGSDPWIVGLGELQTMGEALRLDPLGLPVALSSLPRPPWPENFDLLDGVGMVRQGEESRALEGEDGPRDGTEYMLARSRVAAGRHPAVAPGLAGWIEVTRWKGVDDRAIYCNRERDDFALLVRGADRYIWVTCPGSLERKYDLLPVVASALSFWLARLVEAGFPALPAAFTGPIYARFRLELDRRPGPQLALAAAEMDTRLILGPGFVEALCRGNNDADRMLVDAVLSGFGTADEGEARSVLDEIAPRGRGTVAIWPHPEETSSQPRLGPLPTVEARFRREVELSLVDEGEVLIASEEQLEPALENLARGLETAIQGCLDSLEPAALRDLLALHELAVHESSMEAILLPARSEMGFAEAYPDIARESFHRDLALRILIERCSALPPHGSQALGRRLGSWLRAATELQLELRGALDVVRWEKAGGRVAVSSELGVVMDLGGELRGASEAMREQIATAAPDLMAKAHADWWGEQPEVGSPRALDEPLALEGDWAEVDPAMADEWGVGLEQMLRLLYALGAIADEQPDCVSCSAVGRVELELVRRTAIPAAVVARTVERLTLSPCPRYDTFGEEHQPGRANRERSYLRRPLVALPNGELCWSSLHCKRAAHYLGSLIESGRLGASGALGKTVKRISQGLDHDFEDAVLATVRDCGWRGEPRRRELGGVPLRRRRGEEIGDIDVLAWSPERRTVWLLDAKRLNPGVEPGPMLREGQAFKKHVAHHEERLRWVLDHLPELAQEIGVPEMEGWQVHAALVLDRPLAGAHLGQVSMPIWTHWALRSELSGEGERTPDGPGG